MIISTSGGGLPITYVNVTAAGVWQGWQQLATATDLDTKVSKSGDTMTGPLFIQKQGGTASLDVNSVGAFLFANNGDSNVGRYLYLGTMVGRPTDESSLVLNVRNNNGYGVDYSVLHTGNAQSLGYPKIAIGSYVGTGTYGSSNPNTLTFDFEPKIVFLSVDSSASAFSQTGFMFFIRNQSGSPSWYFYNVAYVGRTITWSGNALSWYTLAGNPNDAPDRQQFNVSGQRYCYVALG